MSCSITRKSSWPDRAMSTRWPGMAKRRAMSSSTILAMHARYLDGMTIRPLRDGDVGTVTSLFERLGERSREQRFCGAKPRLRDAELAALARVDGNHHVLVAY